MARRIQRFLDPASGDTFNIDIATESFMRGGWFGRGPGEGTVKRLLPESHTDFVFAVAAEEFGVVLCLALVALFAFIVIRMLLRAMRNDDPFTRFAAAGLAILFGDAVGDQYGGEPASDPGQGHDAAVHLLRRLLDDLARLCDGHAAGADARTAARRDLRRPNSRWPGAEFDERERRAARSARCRRHGRPSVSRRGLAIALGKHGVTVDLATDHRAAHFEFPARGVHLIPSATLRGRNPFALAPHGVACWRSAPPRHGA